MVLTEALQKKVVKLAHTGHQGIEKTKTLMKQGMVTVAKAEF